MTYNPHGGKDIRLEFPHLENLPEGIVGQVAHWEMLGERIEAGRIEIYFSLIIRDYLRN